MTPSLIQAIALSATLFATLVPTPAAVQMTGQDREDKESAGTQAEFDRREAAIEDELKTETVPDWAGSYSLGDGLGRNVDFVVAPRSGFTFTWTGCMGLYDLNYGSAEVRDGRLVLTFAHVNRHASFQGLSDSLIPIVWGQRRYLIQDDEVRDFANSVNGGFEPCDRFCGGYLMKVGDHDRKVKGLPKLPPEYDGLIVSKPIVGRITRVLGSEIVQDDLGYIWRDVRVEIDAGRRDGVWEGMFFTVLEPDELEDGPTVTHVGEDSSEAVLRLVERTALPRPGSRLSTRVISHR